MGLNPLVANYQIINVCVYCGYPQGVSLQQMIWVEKFMDNRIYRNKTLRLENYDYTQNGLYFITICTNNRYPYFAKIDNGLLKLNSAGKMIKSVWLDIESRFDFIKLHTYIVMPNHFHAIVEIIDSKNSTHIGEVIGAFKSLTTNEYIKGVHSYNWLPFDKRLWQKNYYEHIIRNEKSYLYIADYTKNNPLKWELDRFYTL